MRIPSRESDAGQIQRMADERCDEFHDPEPDADVMLFRDEYDERVDQE